MKNLGSHLSIIGLATVLIWIGLFKFTPTEAKAIEPLVASSPMMSWLYNFLSVQQVSNLIGSIEVLMGLLVLANYLTSYGGLLGGFFATVTFLTTLSFIFSSPSGIQQIDNFVLPDAFILKDLMALGISVDLFWRAYTAIFTAPKS
jgi:reactive chlorine resistance protein C